MGQGQDSVYFGKKERLRFRVFYFTREFPQVESLRVDLAGGASPQPNMILKTFSTESKYTDRIAPSPTRVGPNPKKIEERNRK